MDYPGRSSGYRRLSAISSAVLLGSTFHLAAATCLPVDLHPAADDLSDRVAADKSDCGWQCRSWRFASSGFNCAGSEFAQSLCRHLGEAFHRRRQLRCSRAESDREPLGFTALYDREQIAAGSQCRRPVRCVSYGLLCWKPHSLDMRPPIAAHLTAPLPVRLALP